MTGDWAGFLLSSEEKLLLSPAPPWLDSQKSTETRQTTLSDYCHSLVNLPPHISRCTHLTSFFQVRPEDENPPAPNMSVPRLLPSLIIITEKTEVIFLRPHIEEGQACGDLRRKWGDDS